MKTLLFLLALVTISDTAVAEIRVERDVTYTRHGDDTRKMGLDVYAPEAGAGHPIMVWIHGGAWRIGDKRAVQKKPEVFVTYQFVFVSINYRLYPRPFAIEMVPLLGC